MSAIVRSIATAPRSVRRRGAAADPVAAAAALMRALAEALLAGVQRTTELNWQAARRLLAASQSPTWQAQAEQTMQAWRLSWRAYRVCSTTASDVLDLARVHVQADTDEVWRALQRSGLELAGVDPQRALELQQRTRDVQQAFSAYIGCVLALQRELVAVVEGPQ
jgi:hypothetical protein